MNRKSFVLRLLIFAVVIFLGSLHQVLYADEAFEDNLDTNIFSETLTGLITDINEDEPSITIYDIEHGNDITITVQDMMLVQDCKLGDIVDVTFDESDNYNIISLERNNSVWEYTSITSLEIDIGNNIIAIDGKNHIYTSDLMLYDGNDLLSVENFQPATAVLVRGLDDVVWYIETEKYQDIAEGKDETENKENEAYQNIDTVHEAEDYEDDQVSSRIPDVFMIIMVVGIIIIILSMAFISLNNQVKTRKNSSQNSKKQSESNNFQNYLNEFPQGKERDSIKEELKKELSILKRNNLPAYKFIDQALKDGKILETSTSVDNSHAERIYYHVKIEGVPIIIPKSVYNCIVYLSDTFKSEENEDSEDNIVIKAENLQTKKKLKKPIPPMSFKIYKGDMVWLEGTSGAGKTVLLKMLAGYDKRFSGELKFDGCDTWKKNDGKLKQYIGYVPQTNALYDNVTPNELLRYYAKLFADKEDAGGITDDTIEEIINKLGLAENDIMDIKIRPSVISGGERKRISIAIECLRKTKILILDEPDSGLDEENRMKLYNMFQELNKEGITIIFSTHYNDILKNSLDKRGELHNPIEKMDIFRNNRSDQQKGDIKLTMYKKRKNMGR